MKLDRGSALRRTGVLLLAWLAVLPPLEAADQEEARKTATPTYESPILSLLLLPATLLIRMASVLAPREPPTEQHDAGRAGESPR